MTDAHPEQLDAYFAKRQQRAAEVDAFLNALSDYERALFHDAAVMGYVRGSTHPRDEDIPLNKAIVADVVNSCFAHSQRHLYPAVNADFKNRSTTVEYFVQCQQPDDTWAQCSSTSTNAEFIVGQREAHRRARPEFVFRMARRTTRVIVESERTPEPDEDPEP